MRLIDADALKELALWEVYDNPDWDYQYVTTAQIDNAPTIEVEPKHDPLWGEMSEDYYKGFKEGYEYGYQKARETFESKHLCENCEHYPYAPRPLDSDKTHFYTYSYCWKFKAKDYCSKWEKMDEVTE